MVEAKQINFNYKKSNFMMISNVMQNSTNFEVIVNHNNIPLTNSVKYLESYFRQQAHMATTYRANQHKIL